MLQDLRFLVVDDDFTATEGVTALLKKLGVRHVHTAMSGGEALELLTGKKYHFDCVITDVHMPMGNGLELLHYIRTCTVVRNFRPDMPVVMMSGMASPKVASTARTLDVSAFLVKPFSVHALQKAVFAARRRTFPLDYRRYLGLDAEALQVA